MSTYTVSTPKKIFEKVKLRMLGATGNASDKLDLSLGTFYVNNDMISVSTVI